MKELDLTKATKLKWWLENVGDYRSWEIRDCKDICTLTKMCVTSFFSTVGIMVGVGFFLLILSFLIFLIISGLSYFTLFLPEAYYAPDVLLDKSLFTLYATLLVVVVVGTGCTMDKNINMKAVPKWMKPSKKNVTDEEKKPSQTILAIKEMYKSVKDKTCIKVKL